MSEKIDERKIVAYHRVSPTRHDRVSTEGLVLSQKEIKENMHKSMVSSMELAETTAKNKGETITYHYCDEYISGKDNTNQIEFQKMMDDCRKGLIKKIYIRRVNRLGRNKIQAMESMVELDKLKVHIVFIENGIDTSQPFMTAFVSIFVELAEQERENWEKAREEGIRKALADGTKFGRKKKEIDVKYLRTLRKLPLETRPTWKQLEIQFDATTPVLIKNLKDAGYWDFKNRCVI